MYFLKICVSLLGLCEQVFSDAILTSSLSTFGYLAAALFPKPAKARGLAHVAVPALWVTGYGTDNRPGSFQRADSQEPCMHFYRPSTGSCNLAHKEPDVCVDYDSAQTSEDGLPAAGLRARRSLRGSVFLERQQRQKQQQQRRQLRTEAHKMPHKSRRPNDPLSAQAAYNAIHGPNTTATGAVLPSPILTLPRTLLAANADRLVC
jgi:hypothetical protein